MLKLYTNLVGRLGSVGGSDWLLFGLGDVVLGVDHGVEGGRALK